MELVVVPVSFIMDSIAHFQSSKSMHFVLGPSPVINVILISQLKYAMAMAKSISKMAFIHSIYIRTVRPKLYSLTLVLTFPSRLVSAEIECMVHVALPKVPINPILPIQQSRKQALRALTVLIYILCLHSNWPLHQARHGLFRGVDRLSIDPCNKPVGYLDIPFQNHGEGHPATKDLYQVQKIWTQYILQLLVDVQPILTPKKYILKPKLTFFSILR